MKYIIVSGGVVSGIGKGVIGTLQLRELFTRAHFDYRSLFDRFAAKDDRVEGHGDKN